MRPPQRWGGVDDATLLTEQCFYHILVLSGDYAELFALAKGHGPLGRGGGGTNPQAFIVFGITLLISPGKNQFSNPYRTLGGGPRGGRDMDWELTRC